MHLTEIKQGAEPVRIPTLASARVSCGEFMTVTIRVVSGLPLAKGHVLHDSTDEAVFHMLPDLIRRDLVCSIRMRMKSSHELELEARTTEGYSRIDLVAEAVARRLEWTGRQVEIVGTEATRGLQ